MIEITMPRLSDTMEEGAIAAWHKHPGDAVTVGEVLVDIETDKATMEYEAYEAGTLSKILVQEGENVTIGTPIALLDNGTGAMPDQASTAATTTDPSAQAAASSQSDEMPGTAGPSPAQPDREAPDAAGQEQQNAEGRRFASPLVRKLARDHHLDLTGVHGSGPGGRIIRQDIDSLLEQPPSGREPAPTAVTAARVPPTAGPGEDRRRSEAVPMSRSRRVIARRLAESARTIPHFFVTAAADAESLMQLRGDLNAQLLAAGRPKVSVNDLLIRASALALRQHPEVNASYGDDGDSVLVHQRVNVGVAVASKNGLVVPVLEDADRKTVTELSAEAKELVSLANGKGLTPVQMSGGTFTVSNLGMFGVEQFTAIINPPEAAILAVGGTAREPSVVGDAVAPRYRMRYTLSADHRVIDGALAAQFLQTLTHLIEHPWTILA
jgi:pyruvate dehydrogenase E2 component (dihydrolipoamide acetyltransferase)